MLTRACRLKQLPGRSVHWLGRLLGRPVLVSFEEIISHSVIKQHIDIQEYQLSRSSKRMSHLPAILGLESS